MLPKLKLQGRNRRSKNKKNRQNGYQPYPAQPAPRALDELPEEEVEPLPGVWQYMYGEEGQISPAKMSRVPGHMILPFCIMRLQTRLCQLTGGPHDPDLQAEFEADFEELMVGLEGRGRTEAVTIASAEATEEDEDMPSAKLFGTR